MNRKNAYELFMSGKEMAANHNYLQSLMFFEKACQIEPARGSIHEALAVSYYNCGFYKPSKKHFKIAIDIDPANDFSYYGLGLCLAKEGRFKTAIGNIKIAFAMKPGNQSYKRALKKYEFLLNDLKD
ncbi:MAG: hypothetical protein JW997_01835 [Actinobacteria bacterium]|nr:hypothetical protein [Actinomycetota bacterium]